MPTCGNWSISRGGVLSAIIPLPCAIVMFAGIDSDSGPGGGGSLFSGLFVLHGSRAVYFLCYEDATWSYIFYFVAVYNNVWGCGLYIYSEV